MPSSYARYNELAPPSDQEVLMKPRQKLRCQSTAMFCLCSMIIFYPAITTADNDPLHEQKNRSYLMQNHVENKAISPEEAEHAKVRIGLKIKEKSEIMQEELKHVLRASAMKSNHFYIGPWHILSKPREWNRHHRAFSIELTFFRLFGKNHEVEEKAGSLTIRGRLYGDKSPYTLHGVTHEMFKDKQGKIMAEITAGYHPGKNESMASSQSSRNNISKPPPAPSDLKYPR